MTMPRQAVSATSAAFSPNRLTAMLLKETRQILRDPSTMLIAFLLPLILLFLFGYGVSLDTARTRIGLAVQDNGEVAQSLAIAFQRSRWFEVEVSSNLPPLKADLVAGKIRGIVIIPQDFSRGTARGTGTLQVITDGSLPNTASFVAAYAQGVQSTWAAGRNLERGGAGAEAPISLESRYWFNPELASRFFLVPGSMAIVMTMIGCLLTALVVAREWERGTMEAIMATPVGMIEFIASKVIPYFLLGLGSMTICTLAAVFVFGIPFRGSFIALLAVSAAFMVPALGQGLFISAATKNQFVASQVALLTSFLPAMLLSGFLFEISSMPRPVQLLTFAVPVRYLIPPLQTIFLVGDVWPLILSNILPMLGFGLLFFAGAVRVTKRRIA